MTFLMIFHMARCVFLVAVILVQPGKSDGGGIGFGSSSQSIFGSKGAGNFLTRTTTAVAVIFLLTSFVLTRARIKEDTASVISGSEPASESKTEKASVPSANQAPAAPATPASPKK